MKGRNFIFSRKHSKVSDLQNIKYLSIGNEHFTEYKENEILKEYGILKLNEILKDTEDPKILKIPQMRNTLINLVKVVIERSNLNTIDKVFFDFKNLKEIILNLNFDLTELKTNTFKDLPALKILDLHNNGIRTIQSGAFENLHALTELILSNNRIKTIEAGTFYNLPKLKTINLRWNSISKIKTGSFYCLKNSIGLFMQTELIVNIEEAAFIDIPNFRKLSNGLSLCPNKRMHC